MHHSLAKRWGSLAAAIALGLGLAIIISLWPKRTVSPVIEGQALLGKAAEQFTDAQTGLQFAPPRDWSMQGQSLWTPLQRQSPRLIVKYKRLAPNVSVAWLRVFIHDVPAVNTPVNFLQNRKLPETNWRIAKNAEGGFKVAGHEAARITYAGPLDPTGRGSSEYTAEFLAIRRDNELFEISGMYPQADETAREQIRKTLESIAFRVR